MHRFVSLNLQILPTEKAFISAISAAALYGKGCFTTLAVYDKKPFLRQKHWQRLADNAKRLKIDLSEFSEEKLNAELSQIIAQNDFRNGRVRVTFFEQAPGGVWNFAASKRTNLLLTSAEFRETKSEMRLAVSPFPINSKSPLAGVKSCNYLENLLVFDEAQKRGFDEAIRLNEKGEIASAAMANIFWVRERKIFTPSLETGCLAGTTRAFLLENFMIYEVATGLDEMIEADEIFLTSAGIGICPAVIEKKTGKPSQITFELGKFLDSQKVKA